MCKVSVVEKALLIIFCLKPILKVKVIRSLCRRRLQ